MHSYLIISHHTDRALKHAYAICETNAIDALDRTIIERGEVPGKSEEGKLRQSLGIDDVKRLQKTLSLKPFRGDIKALIIKEAHLLTTEAQNALLKMLEEPPENTVILLLANNEDTLLPTVRSRTTIVRLSEEPHTIPEDRKELIRALFTEMTEWKTGDALKTAEKLAKNKDDAIHTIEEMIILLREQILQHEMKKKPSDRSAIDMIKQLQILHRTISTTNVNLRLALEQFFLGIHRS